MKKEASPLEEMLRDELCRVREILDELPTSSKSRALRIRAASFENALLRFPRSDAGDPQRRAMCDLVSELRFAAGALRTAAEKEQSSFTPATSDE